MRKIFFLIASLFFIASAAQVYTPSQMPDVQRQNAAEYVSDPAGLLTPDVKAQVNSRLAELRRLTTAEAVVAIPPEIGDLTPAEWCEELFTDWGIGKNDKDNGVLLMISPGSRVAFIMTGYGMEGVLPDIACKRIINEAVVPAMREGNLDAAVLNSTDLIYKAATDPAVAEELRSAQPDNTGGEIDTIDPKVIWIFARTLAMVLFAAGLVFFVRDCVIARSRKSNFLRAQMWRGHLAAYFWLGVLSLGAGLIFFLLALWQYRRWRTRPLVCSTCGAKMRRLPEEKDNELLSPAQDLEERLNTVDYDVWECPSCGTVERYPYKVKQTKYTECPSCHTVAMCLECDRTVRPATTRAAGEGVRIYECKFCHNRTGRRYTIPRKEDGSALAAAAVIGAAAAGRRGGDGFGGGGFGGGFGGGATGGGGAGGSW